MGASGRNLVYLQDYILGNRQRKENTLKGEMTLFEQTFKNIDDILHKDAGCSSELDYVEQTSWILFLRYLDDFEKDKETRPVVGQALCRHYRPGVPLGGMGGAQGQGREAGPPYGTDRR